MNKKTPNKQAKKPPKPTNQQTNQPKKTKKTQLDFFYRGVKEKFEQCFEIEKNICKELKRKT